MRKLNMYLLMRLFVTMTMVCTISIASPGGVTKAAASTISQTNSDGQVVTAGGSKTYNDTDPAWTYTGNWAKANTRNALGGQLHIANAAASYATISIKGTGFTLIYTKSRSSGDLDVYVDDQKIGTINQNGSKTSHQREWDSPELASGTHVLKFVQASGKIVNIDAIKVRGPKANPGSAPTGTPTLEATPTQVAPQLPNPTETPTPVQSDPAVLTVTPSPTTPVLVAEPTSTLPPEPSASPTFSEVAPTETFTPELIPTSTPSEIPSPTASFTATASPTPSQLPSATATPTSPINPTPTNTQVPTFTATATPTSTVTSTATSAPAPGTSLRSYYVSAAGNNTDGKSWGTAWTGFNQVNWSMIQPGDTIYLSGGSSGTTYQGGIRISKSGTASGYITIDTGANSPSPAGHNGTVTIEGGDYCILVNGSYIKVRNLLCQHAASSGFRIEGTATILENNTVRETYGQGIHVHYCKSCVVRGNRVTTFPNDGPNENRPYQTDGIVAYESSDTLIERNWIRLTNQYGPAHIDGIQASTKLGTKYENITIQYNYVENTKVMTSNSQGIYLTQMEGNVKIIGNVVNHPSGNQTVVSYLANTVGAPVNVFVVGNTIKCAGYRCLLVGDDNPVIKNNVIWQTGSGQLVDLRDNTSCNPANINNNLYYAPNSSYPFAGSCGRSWSDWQTRERLDATGIFGQNPNVDSCLRTSSDSPAVGKGATLTNEYNQGLATSMCGLNGPDAFLPVVLNNRNQQGGSSWDIGAYELP